MDFGAYFSAGVHAFISVLGFILCAVGTIVLVYVIGTLISSIIQAIIGDDEGGMP